MRLVFDGFSMAQVVSLEGRCINSGHKHRKLKPIRIRTVTVNSKKDVLSKSAKYSTGTAPVTVSQDSIAQSNCKSRGVCVEGVYICYEREEGGGGGLRHPLVLQQQGLS